ncbi:MAG: galactose-1-phosphate uridylyltransferase [Thermodesulfovibrionia bacterium]|nr:galactose-1-phosphate uridylyltransferase [Thermodesulfovibrionia bacterium]MCK5512481.1 galactose-1-phosphate uridylyltransferase [Thermodesulfovibrionia bacterium]
MSELRKDPISGRWVIISVERGKRPTDFGMRVSPKKMGFCAFCNGNEHTTPPEIIAVRPEGSSPNSADWSIRVVPNKFPALHIESQLNQSVEGMYDKMDGVGAHEVIIESPNHNVTFSTLPLQSVEKVLWIFHRRISDLKKDNRLKYVLIFKNEGDAAGASLEHTHTQLIALPIVPKLVEEEINNARTYFNRNKRCIFCDIIKQEKIDKKRVILENENYISFAPFAARSPFETWILPKKHESSFVPNGDFSLLALILQQTLKQTDKILSLPPYNMMIHISPFENESNEYYHWHIEIKPKLTKIAGFEWGSGFYINPTPPEEATRFMRDAEI